MSDLVRNFKTFWKQKNGKLKYFVSLRFLGKYFYHSNFDRPIQIFSLLPVNIDLVLSKAKQNITMIMYAQSEPIDSSFFSAKLNRSHYSLKKSLTCHNFEWSWGIYYVQCSLVDQDLVQSCCFPFCLSVCRFRLSCMCLRAKSFVLWEDFYLSIFLVFLVRSISQSAICSPYAGSLLLKEKESKRRIRRYHHSLGKISKLNLENIIGI